MIGLCSGASEERRAFEGSGVQGRFLQPPVDFGDLFQSINVVPFHARWPFVLLRLEAITIPLAAVEALQGQPPARSAFGVRQKTCFGAGGAKIGLLLRGGRSSSAAAIG
ncbi:hypothetical protein BN77_4243 [Rhizobium mesoamericanum STM3625]|uniref:Uncharacterized protein n=1 Tax=Rhizobium mesoamericanum STM3625 TaxID=1211777 RepID=K0PTQ1_9HYPH|nr:hypothetical protein BN77_4243 [Rhizobium mesoamericanum STM3625]